MIDSLGTGDKGQYQAIVEGPWELIWTPSSNGELLTVQPDAVLGDTGIKLMHWEHRFNHMVKRYNDIYRVQMPNITPHVCRHTYCSNQAKAGMNPKTLQYLMGHSDIGVTLNTYTHLGLEDAAEELRRMEEAEAARREQEKLAGKVNDAQKLFKAV